MTTGSNDWLSKVVVLDTTRSFILNRVSGIPMISTEDLENKIFMCDILNRIKAISILLNRNEFAKSKGHSIIEIYGGQFTEFLDGDNKINPLPEMYMCFSEFLEKNNLFYFRDLYDDFWLKNKPTFTQLEVIGLIPYVDEIGLYVAYNSGDEIRAWIK